MTMHRKGINHIDFAIAMSVMILVIAFSIFYVTSYFSRASPADKTSELQSAAEGIGKILFDSAGIPQNWENNNYIPVRVGLRADLKRIAITAAEKGGVNHSFEEADLHVIFDPNCLNTTYNNSIRVYDRFMNETIFRIYNQTECSTNSGFLREANINFLFNITGNASQIFWFYFTNNTATPKKSAYNFSYDTSLVGYWKLDSVNASNYTPDSSGYGSDGRLYNGTANCFNSTGCINLTAGQINSALIFDGADDYVNISPSTRLNNITSQLTIETWIKTPLTSRGAILERWLYNPTSDRSYVLTAQTDGSIQLQLSPDGLYPPVGTGSLISSGKIPPNTWTHVAATSDGITMKIYINGIQDANTANAPVGGIYVPSINLHIGAWWYGSALSTSYFNGTIDEVKIYNRSLSADEIKALYNYTRLNYIVSSSSVPVVTDKKISALQNLSYADVKSSLDLKSNFNITACEYSFGRHIPDIVNVMSSTYPVMIINASGSVKPCLAGVNVW